MSLKTRLRISIVALVTIVVVALSALYLYDFTQSAFEATNKRAHLLETQIQEYLNARIDHNLELKHQHPRTPEEAKQAWTEVVSSDKAIPRMLQRSAAGTDVVVGIEISGEDGRILASSNVEMTKDKPVHAEHFESVLRANAFRNLMDLLTRTEDYTITEPLGISGELRPVFNITVVISSNLLHEDLRNILHRLALAFVCSLIIAIMLAFALPSLVLNPLERLSRRIDQIRTGEFEGLPEFRHGESREFAAVQSKLSLLGQQFRGAQQDAAALRSNVQEMLQRLDEAVLLFDAEDRLMMAGQPAERLLGKTRADIIGQKLEELFPQSTMLGATICDAVQRREALIDRIVTIERNGAGRTRMLVNLEVLRPGTGGDQIGTLLTLRDAETRRQLELQLAVSSRLAAISRLTAGVAHEIKNPLNAIALHVEVLKSKLDERDQEIEVISSEIRRLDRVVKAFLNFNKPVELAAKPLDLNTVAIEIVHLVEPDARARSISIDTHLDGERWINADCDLLKQAILNVVMNAVEAMDSGGALGVETREVEGDAVLAISDTGPGIPAEIQNKIFDLFFSTKKAGSGIGLAMAFRLVQLHSGTIELSSELGRGTSFYLRFPAISPLEAGRAVRRAHS